MHASVQQFLGMDFGHTGQQAGRALCSIVKAHPAENLMDMHPACSPSCIKC